MKVYRGVDVYIHVFLTMALVRDDSDIKDIVRL
jgi:hypothetical protein